METKTDIHGKKSYREKIYVNGREIKGPFFSRKTDARLWRSGMEQARAKNGDKLLAYYHNRDLSFKDYALRFIDVASANQELARTSHITYRSRLLNHLIPILGDVPLRKISLLHYGEVIEVLRKQGRSSNGINHILMLLKRVLNQALSEGLILNNPINHAKKMKEELRAEMYMTKEEIEQLIERNVNDPYLPIILIAMNTGLRRGELAALSWDCIDLEGQLLMVRRTRDQKETKNNTKTGRGRYVPMNEVVLRLLTEEKSKQQARGSFAPSGLVFQKVTGQIIDVHHLYRFFNRMQDRAGLSRHFRIHDLRHTYASHYMMNGGNICDLQRILGHTRSEMTNRYVHLSKERIASCAAVVCFDYAMVA